MNKLAIGTKSSVKVEKCQVCDSNKLEEVVSLGHLPQVNVMQPVGSSLEEEIFFPAELLKCNNCSLVQLSHVVDPKVIFPPSYAYTSRTTKILRSNFKELSSEINKLIQLVTSDLIVDIGSNDGTLLSNFTNFRIQGVEPTDVAQWANDHGIPTIQRFFDMGTAKSIMKDKGNARVITAANVFAHIEDIHSIIEAIKLLMGDTGIFVSESHYLIGLMKTNQYDTIYHEHLRYYSLTSLKHLFAMHDLEIFHTTLIPTHGGSIRVYAAKKGEFEIDKSVSHILASESKFLTKEIFQEFKTNIVKSKCVLYELLNTLGGTIGAVGAPSRASTLVNYVGLNEDILKFVLEAPGSNKINKYMPGTKIPVLEENNELINSVDNLLLLSWHISDEIIPKLKNKGFRGNFIIPLPQPTVIKGIE